MSFFDTVKERVSNLEARHYYIIGGGAAAIIIVIILLVALGGFPGERFGDYSHGGKVARLAFNSNGSLLASSEFNAQAKAFIWDVASRTRVSAVDGNSRDSRMLTFTQDNSSHQLPHSARTGAGSRTARVARPSCGTSR
jgi:WD40 repeat protein